jgi:hypothetical protein
MYVVSMTTDSWTGTDSSDEEIVNPSWSDIEARIVGLDAAKYTMVTLRGDDPAYLVVGGGVGKYVVYATFDNNQFLAVCSKTESNSRTLLYIGGQEGDYPDNIVVDASLALTAAKTFFESGQLDKSLRWQNK